MTSEAKDIFAEFKKVTGDENASHLNPPLSKEELEDEVLEAVKEAKEAKDELPVLTSESVISKEKAEEGLEKLKELNEKPARPSLSMSPSFVRSLRKADRGFNHTCAKCLTRLPVENFYRGKKDNICIACGGK